MKMTPAQNKRQAYRSRGQYAKVNPCYRCGKSAGEDYRSDRRTDDLIDDQAMCLCDPCANLLAALTDEELFIELARPDYGACKQGK